jgi:hypothetical protein
MAIARAIVDKAWREKFVGPKGNMRHAIKEAGYPVSDGEVDLLSCNTMESFDERFVTIDNFEEMWQISERRVNEIVAQNATVLPKINEKTSIGTL